MMKHREICQNVNLSRNQKKNSLKHETNVEAFAWYVDMGVFGIGKNRIRMMGKVGAFLFLPVCPNSSCRKDFHGFSRDFLGWSYHDWHRFAKFHFSNRPTKTLLNRGKTASHQGFSLFGAIQCLCLVLASSFRLDHGGFVTNLPVVHQATRLHERPCVSRIPFHWFVCTFNWVPPKKRPRKNSRQVYFFRRGWYQEIRSRWWKHKWTYDDLCMKGIGWSCFHVIHNV